MVHAHRIEQEERVSPLAEQWPYLRFLGLGAWWAWIWLCYNSIEIMRMFPAENQTLYVLEMYLFSTLGIAGCMFVAAGCWRRVTPFLDRRITSIIFGAFAALATILLAFSVIMGAGAFFVIAAIFTGIATSGLCLKVGRIYGSVSLGDSLTAGAISLLLAALLYFVGVGIPTEWRLFYIAFLPLCSGILLSMQNRDPFQSAPLGAAQNKAERAFAGRMFRKLVMASALVAVTAGVGKGIASVTVENAVFAREGTIIVFCVGVLAVLIAYVVNRGDTVRGARQVYSALMVLGVAMMLATCFGLDIAFLSIGKESLWLVLSCFMAYLAFRFDLSAVRVFGIGQGVYFLGSMLGWAIGALVAPYYADTMVRMGMGIVLAFLVILVLVYVFPENDLKRTAAWSVDRDAGRDPSLERHGHGSARDVADVTLRDGQRAVLSREGDGATGAIGVAGAAGTAVVEGETLGGYANGATDEARGENAVAAVAVADEAHEGSAAAIVGIGRAADPHYGLSARELEILDLFAQGRSANWIADNLTISKNTVRSHLRAIYTKLDVHTRQELLDFLAG